MAAAFVPSEVASSATDSDDANDETGEDIAAEIAALEAADLRQAEVLAAAKAEFNAFEEEALLFKRQAAGLIAAAFGTLRLLITLILTRYAADICRCPAP